MNVRDGYKLTEMGEIPVEWKPYKLQDISDFITKGATPTTYGFDWESEGILFLKSDCITSSGFSYGQSKFISEDAHLQMNRSIVKPGDILMSITGYIGKVIVLPNLFSEANINQHIARIRINSQNHSSKFIYYSLTMPQQTELLMKNSTGQAYPQISLVQVRNIVLYIPPLPEQQKIADILSTVDEHISETESLIEKTKVLKQGIMQRLLTKGIGHTEFKDTEIGRIPIEWEVKKIRDSFKISAGGDIYRLNFSKIQFGVYEFPVFSNALSNKGLYGYCDTFEYEGEFITITARGDVGHALCRSGKFVAVGRVLVLNPVDIIDCKFIAEYIENLVSFNMESTGVPQLTAPQAGNHYIAIPPLLEQQKIASILTSIDNQIDSSQTKQTSLTQLKSALMQQLLTGKTRVKI